ncbi:MAG: lysophospholipid acyltransferase family protein [Deltaproteobacteria bacterium]
MIPALAAPFHDEGHGYDVFGLRPRTLARAITVGRVFHDAYFRVSSSGIEHVPASGPTIVIANHGGILPIDAAMLCLDLLLRTDPPRVPRALADHFVASLPIVGTLFARLGVVMGTRGNARRLLERGELLAIWPEGVSGPAKPFSHRYELQAWRTGFAELALRYHAKVIPAAIVGAEESWPMIAKLAGVHALHIPYLPIPATPLPLPAHFHIRYGEPIELVGDPDDPRDVEEAALAGKIAVENVLADARRGRTSVWR